MAILAKVTILGVHALDEGHNILGRYLKIPKGFFLAFHNFPEIFEYSYIISTKPSKAI